MRHELYVYLTEVVLNNRVAARVLLNGNDGLGAEGMTPAVRANLSDHQVDMVLGFGSAPPIEMTTPRFTLDLTFWLWYFDHSFQGFNRIWAVGNSMRSLLDSQMPELGDWGTPRIQFKSYGPEVFSPDANFKDPQRRDVYSIQGQFFPTYPIP